MATPYRGEVEFTDSAGTAYVLRLSTFHYINVQSQAEKLDGRAWQLFMFHQALIHGAETQQAMTQEDAGEILDDLGYLRADELLSATKFGLNSAKAADEQKRRQIEATNGATRRLAASIAALKIDVTDETLLHAIDLVTAKVEASIAPGEALHPPTAIRSSA